MYVNGKQLVFQAFTIYTSAGVRHKCGRQGRTTEWGPETEGGNSARPGEEPKNIVTRRGHVSSGHRK